jgi:hypothetical protein
LRKNPNPATLLTNWYMVVASSLMIDAMACGVWVAFAPAPHERGDRLGAARREAPVRHEPEGPFGGVKGSLGGGGGGGKGGGRTRGAGVCVRCVLAPPPLLL